jgi:hypothetical protein
VADDYVHENVVNLEANAGSILNFYKALITLRKQHPQLVIGTNLSRGRATSCSIAALAKAALLSSISAPNRSQFRRARSAPA